MSGPWSGRWVLRSATICFMPGDVSSPHSGPSPITTKCSCMYLLPANNATQVGCCPIHWGVKPTCSAAPMMAVVEFGRPTRNTIVQPDDLSWLTCAPNDVSVAAKVTSLAILNPSSLPANSSPSLPAAPYGSSRRIRQTFESLLPFWLIHQSMALMACTWYGAPNAISCCSGTQDESSEAGPATMLSAFSKGSSALVTPVPSVCWKATTLPLTALYCCTAVCGS